MGTIYRPIFSFVLATVTVVLGFFIVLKVDSRIDLAVAGLVPLLIAIVIEASRIGKDDQQIGREDGIWSLARGVVLSLYFLICMIEFPTFIVFVLDAVSPKEQNISSGDFVASIGILTGMLCQSFFCHIIYTILETKPPPPSVICPGEKFSLDE